VGGLIGATGIAFWPIWTAAVLGAIGGDRLAYDLAFRFKSKIVRWWPLSRHPDLVARGMEFFETWEILAVVLGRFFGPLRASVPIAAGICGMPWLKFQIANVTSVRWLIS
jgi:membrane protein DedA with SNARE-associated domain